jgi:ATP-binding cassette subfamily B protein
MNRKAAENLEPKTGSQGFQPRPMGGGNPMGMMMPNQKPKNFKKTMGKLWGYLRPFWLSLVVVVVFTIASTIFAIVGPKILGNMTNQISDDFVSRKAYDQIMSQIPQGADFPSGTTGSDILRNLPPAISDNIPPVAKEKIANLDLSRKPAFNYDRLVSLGITLLILYCMSAVFAYIQSWIMTGISQKITYRFRQDISKKIGRMPLKYFDKTTHGEVLSRITNDVDTVSQTLNQSMTQIISSVTMIIGILAMMISISWQMTFVALITLPLSFGLIAFVVKRSQKYYKLQQDTLGHLNGHIEEMYGGHSVMKVFNGQKRSIAIFSRHNNELYGSAWRSQFLSGLLFPIINFVGNIGYVGVTVLGGYLAIHGRINIGDIQAFIQYVSQFNQPIIQTANVASVLQSTAASAERVFEFLAEDEDMPDSNAVAKLTDVKGAVNFENVSFGYNSDTTIIHDFTAKIESGQRIAIVGPTGAGKTTIVNLLMRFYEIDRGRITVDGLDIHSMHKQDVRKLFGMVLQDTWLFKGTIRENLIYGKPDATDMEIAEAANAAHVDHFIHSLPHGYEMVIDEEANNISQGEKQLLTIARAMLIKTPMLILDEATSSVDTRTEILIQKAMERLMKGKTSFVIAHRLSTIKNADLILVMRDGNIVEQGKHQELLNKKGFYASLYNSQFTESHSA